ncbi:hypothetical protein F8388_027309 [Cannabis sativa]|uniref:F-box protein n=1 Tax=Cannabis sativa TaxID=3483 RepID=A0A7J6FPJ9_CANSA|nr:hypothetical protein F8388_027309 [Cannabis sativa]
MSSLPGDAIQNILCRLEVKDLPALQIHLQHSKETDSHLSLIRNDPELNAIDVDTLNSSIRLNPFDERDGVEIVACVDGLLILANFIGDMAIWNPSTKKYKKLLASDLNVNPFPDCIVEYGITGFGMASSFNGTLNWMVSGESTSYESIIIVGFDLATEEYRKISMPEKKDIYGKETFHTNMTHLGGWLCVESWTKLAMVMPSGVTGPFDYLSPLVHFKNANQLLFDQSGDKSLVKVCGGERGSNGKKAEENGNKRKKQGQQLGILFCPLDSNGVVNGKRELKSQSHSPQVYAAGILVAMS